MPEILCLEALRDRYQNASGSEIFDPEFRKVADLVFGDGDNRQAPYWGVPTLLKAPLRQDAAPDFTDIDVALLGIPLDLGVTNRPGARSALAPFATSSGWGHMITCCEPFQLHTSASQMSATCHFGAVLTWQCRTRISSGLFVSSSKLVSCRCQLVVITRSDFHCFALWGVIAPSA